MKRKGQGLSSATRIIIFVSIFLFVANAALGVLLMSRSINKMRSIIQNKILEISIAAAGLVDGDEIASLTKEDKENNTPAYADNYQVLSSFKTSSIDNNAELAYIYCLVKTADDRIVFSIDPDEESSSVFLEEETIYTLALERAFQGQAGFDDLSYVDRWGDLLSAYAPVFGADGTVKAVIGVDVWSAWYNQEIWSGAIAIGVATTVTTILGISLALIIAFRMRRKFDVLSQEMYELETDVRALLKDIDDSKYINESVNEDEQEKDRLVVLKKQIDNTKQEIKEYMEHIHNEAFSDALTKLGNRNAYFEKVKEIDEMIQNGTDINFAVIVLDINGLKEINDHYGHEAGDEAIIISGEALSDVFGRENSYRIGGDELVSIYINATTDNLDARLVILNELVKSKAQENENVEFDLTTSQGYSVYGKKQDKCYQDVFKRADEKMYKLKAEFYKSIGKKTRK